jgi:flavin-dependent dehydrogenase
MNTVYDVLIIGGGIAGLAAATLFAKDGYRVIVFEKDQYPRHKVCGEYISRESLPFLTQIGLDVLDQPLPQVNQLLLTTSSGARLQAGLPLGGIGLSRYAFDAALARSAERAGALVRTQTKVTGVERSGDSFIVQTSSGAVSGRLVLGSWGKKSNLDVQLQRPFLRKTHPVLDGWVGIKHHIRYDAHPENQIALHTFPGGYCGISQVEDDRCCLCYLVQGERLRQAGNRIPELEATVLNRNPHLRRIWEQAQFLFPKPLAISGISFQRRAAVEDGVLCLGDAAGLIPPLSGNGMSMALHSALLAFEQGSPFLAGLTPREAMEQAFTQAWNRQFRSRMQMGRLLQGRFSHEGLLEPVIGLLNTLPFLKRMMIQRTHGSPF